MKDILRKLKYFRLKPEEKDLIDILNKTTKYDIPNIIVYKYFVSNQYDMTDHFEVLFQYDINQHKVFIQYGYTWSDLQLKRHLNFDDFIKLRKKVIQEYLFTKDDIIIFI
jgi:hypothetical protein